MAYIKIRRAIEDEQKIIEISINKGDLIILSGPFGSGKTTLLDCISLVDKRDEIKVSLNNNDIKKLNIKQKIKYKREQISYGSLHFINNITVLDNILMMCKTNKNYMDINSILSEFKIEHLVYSYPNNLSKKELGLLVVAMAVIKNTDIILIDDAVDNLDKKTKKEVLSFLNTLCKDKNKTIIITCENIDDINDEKIIDILSGDIISKKKDDKEIKEKKNNKTQSKNRKK